MTNPPAKEPSAADKQQSQLDGPAAYSPHTEEEKKQIKPKASDKKGKLVGVVGDNDLA